VPEIGGTLPCPYSDLTKTSSSFVCHQLPITVWRNDTSNIVETLPIKSNVSVLELLPIYMTTKGWTIAYHPGWKLCTQSSMSKNKRILAARASGAEWYRRSSDEEYEDHEEHHQHKEYLHHQPPVGWNAVEVLQELALCSLHVSQCAIHVLVNSVMDNTAINTR